MESEWNLSDMILHFTGYEPADKTKALLIETKGFISPDDVREFIKRLKEDVCICEPTQGVMIYTKTGKQEQEIIRENNELCPHHQIDKLAGDNLV